MRSKLLVHLARFGSGALHVRLFAGHEQRPCGGARQCRENLPSAPACLHTNIVGGCAQSTRNDQRLESIWLSFNAGSALRL